MVRGGDDGRHHRRRVEEGSPAWEVGIEPGMRIDSVVAAIERLDAASGAATPAEAEA